MSGAPDGYVRVACANENCGTFLLDEALYRKLKRTGDTFHCPEGHGQHFKSETKELRERIEELENKLERAQKKAKREHGKAVDYRKKLSDERDRVRRLKDKVLDDADGVVEAVEDEWAWGCACGSRGRKPFATEEAAREAYQRHLASDAHDGSAQRA